ncbi:hypothetical protein MBLNU457_1585t1 [Dothideomycetes sp. NU457]
MPDYTRRSSTRSGGPTPVSSRSSSYASSQSSSRKSRDSSTANGYARKHHRSDSHHDRKPSYVSTDSRITTFSRHDSEEPAQSSFDPDLVFMGHPPTAIPANYPFQPSVMLKLTDRPSKGMHLPSSGNLVATVALLQDLGNGRYAMNPKGVLRGKPPVDNLHELPSEYISRLPRDLRETALGYFSFPDVQVAETGTYRLRVSLVQLPDVKGKSFDTMTLTCVDSDAFRVSP